ncbi:MAG: arsenite methyltransferase [Leptospirales bacterium]|nr:arsenite methyltransferase [Leptospirales bacterium]
MSKTAEELKESVRVAYSAIAEQSPDQNLSSCCGAGACSTSDTSFMMKGEDYASMAGYNPDADLGLGCGIPTQYSRIKEGHTVIDLGSGAGNDAFIARAQTGVTGRVIGVDMTEAMLQKARKNNEKLGFTNVEFRHGEIENLPVEESTADVVISNCVLNLVPEKARAFSEIYRVLKPGGQFTISDIVLEGTLPDNLREAAEMYAGCVSGAMQKNGYLGLIFSTGFLNVSILKEKAVLIPEDILSKYLSPEEIAEHHGSKIGLKSITLTAEKPGKAACCEPGSGCC